MSFYVESYRVVSATGGIDPDTATLLYSDRVKVTGTPGQGQPVASAGIAPTPSALVRGSAEEATAMEGAPGSGCRISSPPAHVPASLYSKY